MTSNSGIQKLKHPLVKNEFLFTDQTHPGTANSVRIGSSQWFTWLAENDRFVVEGNSGRYLAQREIRREHGYWYGYRRHNKKLFKTYLGRTEELTHDRLEQAAVSLSGKILIERLSDETPGEIRPPKESWGDVLILPLTKIRPPSLPSLLVTRPRLTREFNKPVTILSAPSGQGKSTLLNEWRLSCGYPVAWVTLDPDDNLPHQFWSTVLNAFQVVDLNLGQDLQPYLRSSYQINNLEFANRLSNEILQGSQQGPLPQKFALVLDNFHTIQNSDILSAIQVWLMHLPSGFQLVFSGQTFPALTIGPLRARGLVTELGADDLRFNLKEGIDFLEKYTRDQPLSYNDMEKLVNRTEGWAAGLNLAVLALSKQKDRHGFVETYNGTHNYISDFFKESILSKQSSAVQSFLIKTSILRQLSGPLCDTVTSEHGGAEILAKLWKENLFISRLNEHDWYSYHELFAEMLQEQLQIQYGAEAELYHRRAAEWYQAQNAPVDAVYHLLAINAWEEAAALIEGMALRELETYGEDSRLLRWLQQLPETVVRRHKDLLFVYIRLARLAMSASEVSRFLARIEDSIQIRPEGTCEEQEVLTEITLIRKNLEIPSPTLEQLAVGDEKDTIWSLFNRLQLINPGTFSDTVQREVIAREIYEEAKARQHAFIMVMAGSIASSQAVYQGHLRRGDKLAQKVLQEVYALCGTLPEPSSIAMNVIGHIYYERNQFTQAHLMLDRAAQCDPNPISTNMPITYGIQRSKFLASEGNCEAALAAIQETRNLNRQRPSGVWIDQDLSAYQALIFARCGDLQQAEETFAEYGETNIKPLSSFVRGEINFREGKYAEVVAVLQELLLLYPCGIFNEPPVRYRLMLAISLFELHKVHQAVHLMVETIQITAPEGMIRAYLDYGKACLPLLALLLDMHVLPAESIDFIKHILNTMNVEVSSLSRAIGYDIGMLTTAASISIREQEILYLLSLGLSNREIALRLSIAESTVKTHLGNIYSKLGANGRVQAVARAQTLKVI
jgi:LuxR family transcriptional regulator, maltose regulon positive regulatory protein